MTDGLLTPELQAIYNRLRDTRHVSGLNQFLIVNNITTEEERSLEYAWRRTRIRLVVEAPEPTAAED